MGNSFWFKNAVLYQLHVRAFADSNGDGIGDFRGLIQKIDYFSRLGVTAIWLLPFYPSPLRDDGYDIADYRSVNPVYGDIDDFRRFLDAAHEAGLKVITELVLNHTSDQHPWFQRARRAPADSVERDFYVWNETPDRYNEARIIFKDFESSNWSWDPVAEAYFWHRFYSHQPDLNFENPAVHEALFGVLDFWLEMGVDGLRLDAVPYLYEREGTNCENLPETHAFLRKLRAHIDSKFDDRMLLAEANQWPEDAAAYFGNGDECHMEFHFPLMPRLFMALQMEDRFPVIDILEQTPAIPSNCQWATFLRNHDELTLEMVTDEERDYMYRVYAEDRRARINLGIRRRLAPLLGNSRRRIELLNSLLFSLPGTPIIYYGDEIGMGDNFYLGDRNGVRTPMQWSPDRNAGFSKANPQQLYLPVIIDPEYHYESVNVENQERNVSSLFWWMRRLIGIRKELPSLAHGGIEFVPSSNAAVLAYLRSNDADCVLALANLSRFAQSVDLDLTRFAGLVPVELFSKAPWPVIAPGLRTFTLGPHDFLWFSLVPAQGPSMNVSNEIPSIQVDQLPHAIDRWVIKLFERNFAAPYLNRMRWFGGKSRSIRDVAVRESIAIDTAPDSARLLIVEVTFREGRPDLYQLLVQCATGQDAAAILSAHPAAVIGRMESPDHGEAILFDAVFDSKSRETLLRFLANGSALPGTNNSLTVERARPLGELAELASNSIVAGAEQSNTSVLVGNRFFLKFYRRIEAGANPDVELTRYLTEQKQFKHVPQFEAACILRQENASSVLGMLMTFTENQGDGWSYTLDALARFAERVLASPSAAAEGPALRELIGAVYPARARQLAQRTAEMHLALAGDEPGFAPEAFSTLYQRSLYQALRSSARRTLEQLKQATPGMDDATRALASEVIQSESKLLKALENLTAHRFDASKIRVHGDYHLGQVLNTGKDFVIIDFEGEPKRSLSERQLKRCPLVDVAGMLRSFDYAAQTVLRNQAASDFERLRPWMEFWTQTISEAYTEEYRERLLGSQLVPAESEQFQTLLSAFILEKALYEVGYELTYRPAMLPIPLRAVLTHLGA